MESVMRELAKLTPLRLGNGYAITSSHLHPLPPPSRFALATKSFCRAEVFSLLYNLCRLIYITQASVIDVDIDLDGNHPGVTYNNSI